MAPTPSTRIQSLKARSVFRTNRRRKFAVGAAMLSLLLIASSAAAEPFAITSGAFTFVFNSSSFVEVGGPQFLVTNGDTNPEEFGLPGLALEHANPFATTLPVSGRIQVNLSARLLLTGHPEPEFGSSVLFDLMFNGPAAVAHPTDAACEGCLVIAGTSPFRVTGVLTPRDSTIRREYSAATSPAAAPRLSGSSASSAPTRCGRSRILNSPRPLRRLNRPV